MKAEARHQRIPSYERAHFAFHWFEPHKRRDPDNFAGGKKFVLDGLVCAGVLANDGWSQVAGFSDDWAIGPPGVRVDITPAY